MSRLIKSYILEIQKLETRINETIENVENIQTILIPENRSLSFTFGNGSDLEFDFNHNFNTYKVVINVYKADERTKIYCEEIRVNSNTVRLKFNNPPQINEYVCLISC